MTNTLNPPPLSTPLAHEAFTAARAPAWLRMASAEQRMHLHGLAVAAESARQALKHATERLPVLHTFALELLRAELSALGIATVDPTRAVLYWTDPEGSQPPVKRSLLDAALHNFHARDTEPSAYGAGSGLFGGVTSTGEPDPGQALAITPAAFATRCRALDIGGRFRQALMEHIPARLPSSGAAVQAQPPLSWQAFQAQRKAFIAEACVARLDGRLDATGQSLLAHWNLASAPLAMPARAQRLALLGYPLASVMVFTAQHEAGAPQPVVAYIPGDPNGAVQQYPHAQAFARSLGSRLQTPAYRAFLSRFVPLSQRLAFLKEVGAVVGTHGWLSPHLTWNPVPLAGDPFVDGYRVWAQHTLADAATMAVPTGFVDQRDTRERYAHWVEIGEQLGLSFALMLGSTLPGINLVVDGIVLAQSLYSVYQGVQAWKAGDSRGALDHLFSAVDNTAFFGLGKRPAPTEAAVAFGDSLVPVTGDDGQVRLWQPDLEDFRARDLPPPQAQPDASGVYRHEGRTWLRLDGRFHEVNETTAGDLVSLKTATPQGYAPAFHGDGAGAWRASHEDLSQWNSARLIRRFNHRYESLPDEVLHQAQRFASVSDDQLRAAHLDGVGAPAPLAELLARRLAERELSDVVAALRGNRRLPKVPAAWVEVLPDLPGWPQSRPLEYRANNTAEAPEVGNAVVVTEAELTEGTWPARLIDQLGTAAVEAILGLDASLVPADPVHEMLAQQWAVALERRRGTLVGQRAEPEASMDPARQTLRRHFPGLTTHAIKALLRDRTQAQRDALVSGRVPPVIAERAAESLRQSRLARACEAISQGVSSPDAERVILGVWPQLGTWATAMQIELKAISFHGETVARAGSVDAPRWVIVRRGAGYQAFDEQGLELGPITSLEQAIVATVPDHLRAAMVNDVTDAAGLRGKVLEQAVADRARLRTLLGMVNDKRRFFRPPTRQPNGAIGYELSGRPTAAGAASPYTLALRALYPDVTEAEMTELRASLGEGEAATTALARLNADLARLRLELGQWANRARDLADEDAGTELENRQAIARELIRAWQRREATYGVGGLGYGVDLRGWHVRELPPLSVSLPHVQRLAVVDMRLSHVNDAFLQAFPNLLSLDLSFNDLQALPEGLGQLPRLQRLRLDYTGHRSLTTVLDAVMPAAATLNYLGAAGSGFDLTRADFERLAQFPNLTSIGFEDNLITLSGDTADGFNDLPRLEELSLANNPLSRPPQVDRMHALVWLELCQSGLRAFPPGLQALMEREPLNLRDVDLSGNEIVDIPDISGTRFVRQAVESRDDVQSPYYGMSLNMDGNPLSDNSRDILRHSSFDYFDLPGDDDLLDVFDPDQWLAGCPAPLLALIRAERADREAGPFYQLLSRVVDTEDYRNDPGATRQRAWALVDTWLRPGQQAMPGLEQLRQRLFAMAEDTQGTCGDGVALTLDEMEFEVEGWRRLTAAPGHGDAALRNLLGYQRGLWRRALVDDLARRIVRARVARQAALAQDEPAPGLDPLDDLHDAQLAEGLDEVEVRFYLLQRLEGVLDLPPARGMRYSTRVSGNTVQRVGVQVLQEDTDEAFAAWVAERPGFRIYLESAHAAAFDPVRQYWDDAADHLFTVSTNQEGAHAPMPPALAGLSSELPTLTWEGQRLPSLNDQQLRQAYDWVSGQRQRALDALALRLTRELLGVEQPGPSGSGQ